MDHMPYFMFVSGSEAFSSTVLLLTREMLKGRDNIPQGGRFGVELNKKSSYNECSTLSQAWGKVLGRRVNHPDLCQQKFIVEVQD